MDKIQVVFWTQSGNTQAMAEAIGKGITEAGKEANVVYVGSASLASQAEKQSPCSVLMAGETANGCVTGLSVCRQPAQLY